LEQFQNAEIRHSRKFKNQIGHGVIIAVAGFVLNRRLNADPFLSGVRLIALRAPFASLVSVTVIDGALLAGFGLGLVGLSGGGACCVAVGLIDLDLVVAILDHVLAAEAVFAVSDLRHKNSS
jgi:hypothetical protein